MTQSVTGGCLCGAIRYSISQPVEIVSACHCTHCQKASGTGASHNALVPASAVTFTAGKPKAYKDTAESGNTLFRYFCGDCGSPIYSQRERMPEVMVLKVGTLDDSSGLKLTTNIWTRSARPWMHIDPAATNHPQNRPLAQPAT